MVFDARKWGVGAETNMRVLAMVDKEKTDRSIIGYLKCFPENGFRDMQRAGKDLEIAALCFVAYMCKDDDMITKKALTVYSCL